MIAVEEVYEKECMVYTIIIRKNLKKNNSKNDLKKLEN